MSQITDIVAAVFDFDDTLVPDSTTKLLQDHGIDTAHFWGVEAKELIAQGYDPPAAYLKHGSDLAARIQDEHPGIRVLCITGYAEPSIVKDLGAAILEKPFTPDALLSKVDEILSTLDKASDSRAEL